MQRHPTTVPKQIASTTTTTTMLLMMTPSAPIVFAMRAGAHRDHHRDRNGHHLMCSTPIRFVTEGVVPH